MRTLVTGGIRSGKSAYAESLLPTDRPVTYLATGPVPSADDPDWQARVAAHRLRRPPSWTTVETTVQTTHEPTDGTTVQRTDEPVVQTTDETTDKRTDETTDKTTVQRTDVAMVETTDVAQALCDATGVVLLDSLGSWVSATLDALHAWERPIEHWHEEMQRRLDALVHAVATASADLVVVSEEVGLGLVSEHRSGRIFADWLGTLNQRIAAVSERVVLVVAGCPLPVKDAGS